MASDTAKNRTVLASQAPDCRPTGLPGSEDYSHSGHLIATAAAIASARDEPKLDVLEACADASFALLTMLNKDEAAKSAAAPASQDATATEDEEDTTSDDDGDGDDGDDGAT